MTYLHSHVGKFFEVTAKVQETAEDGSLVAAKRTIACNAASFGEAEEIGIKQLSLDGLRDIDTTSINIAPYKEVFISDETKDEKFFKAKLAFITIDEKSGKEKRTTTLYLVSASSLASAVTNVDGIMRDTMINYDSISITASPVEQAFCR